LGREAEVVGSNTFSLLIWVLGPVSTFFGGALIFYWLIREIRHGDYRPKYGDADLVQALEGVVPQEAIEREKRELAQILDEEHQTLKKEEHQ
jgi:hypothetical protein